MEIRTNMSHLGGHFGVTREVIWESFGSDLGVIRESFGSHLGWDGMGWDNDGMMLGC